MTHLKRKKIDTFDTLKRDPVFGLHIKKENEVIEKILYSIFLSLQIYFIIYKTFKAIELDLMNYIYWIGLIVFILSSVIVDIILYKAHIYNKNLINRKYLFNIYLKEKKIKTRLKHYFKAPYLAIKRLLLINQVKH